MPRDTLPMYDDILRRSHAAAAFCRARGSVLVLGGSRYFTGDYFHDVLELRLAPMSSAERRQKEIQTQLAVPSMRRHYARGVIGRVRGLARHQLIDPLLLDQVLAPP